MDTSITRMMKLNAMLLTLAFGALAYFASLSNEWGYVTWYAICGFLTAGGFTLVWVVTYTNIAELLGKRARSEITAKNVVGSSVAFLAVLMNGCFIAAALSAGQKSAFSAAGWISFFGLAAYLIISIIWAVADYNFVETMKKQEK